MAKQKDTESRRGTAKGTPETPKADLPPSLPTETKRSSPPNETKRPPADGSTKTETFRAQAAKDEPTRMPKSDDHQDLCVLLATAGVFKTPEELGKLNKATVLACEDWVKAKKEGRNDVGKPYCLR